MSLMVLWFHSLLGCCLNTQSPLMQHLNLQFVFTSSNEKKNEKKMQEKTTDIATSSFYYVSTIACNWEPVKLCMWWRVVLFCIICGFLAYNLQRCWLRIGRKGILPEKLSVGIYRHWWPDWSFPINTTATSVISCIVAKSWKFDSLT